MSDDEKFDGMLFTLAGQHQGGIFEVLDTLFSFLARKTDFYYGGEKGQAEKIMLEKFKKYENVAYEKHEREIAEREEKDRIRREKLKKEKEEATASKIVEVNDDEAEKIMAAEELKKKEDAVVKAKSEEPKKADDEEESEEDKGKMLPNSGNGADLKNYNWVQTLAEVDVNIPTGVRVKSRDCSIAITKKVTFQ